MFLDKWYIILFFFFIITLLMVIISGVGRIRKRLYIIKKYKISNNYVSKNNYVDLLDGFIKTIVFFGFSDKNIKYNRLIFSSFLIIKLSCIALLILYFINLLLTNKYMYSILVDGAIIFILIIVYFIPNILIEMDKKKRLERLQKGLPDVLDLLVICAEAGLSLDVALSRVANEFVHVFPELSNELSLTAIELSFLQERRQALANLATRVDLPSFRSVVTTLVQTEKYGTPLSQAFRTLSSDFRENRLISAEEKAARLPAILTIPMICFILPALFIVISAPAFIRIFKIL